MGPKYNFHSRLEMYRDRRTVALIKTFYFWQEKMSRKNIRAWNARGAEIIAKIQQARILNKDKSEMTRRINWDMDRQEAREIVWQHQGRTGWSDDDSS